nr:hypothetical protein [Tanacetum cinerariifolium]
PPLEVEILSFIRELGHIGEIKHLTNKDMLESKAYKTYHAYATGKKKLHAQGLETLTEITLSEAKQIKIGTKRSKIQFHSSHTSGLAITEAQQLKLVTKRSMQQTHIYQASGSGADEGTGSIPRVPDAPIDESEEELSWNSIDDKGDDGGKDGDGDDDD